MHGSLRNCSGVKIRFRASHHLRQSHDQRWPAGFVLPLQAKANVVWRCLFVTFIFHVARGASGARENQPVISHRESLALECVFQVLTAPTILCIQVAPMYALQLF